MAIFLAAEAGKEAGCALVREKEEKDEEIGDAEGDDAEDEDEEAEKGDIMVSFEWYERGRGKKSSGWERGIIPGKAAAVLTNWRERVEAPLAERFEDSILVTAREMGDASLGMEVGMATDISSAHMRSLPIPPNFHPSLRSVASDPGVSGSVAVSPAMPTMRGRSSSFTSLSAAAISANTTLANSILTHPHGRGGIAPTPLIEIDCHRVSAPHHQHFVPSSSSSSGSSGFSSFWSTPSSHGGSAPDTLGQSILRACDVQIAGGAAGEDCVQAVCSEENEWLFCGIYDGFNGRDAADFLAANLYESIGMHMRLLEWQAQHDQQYQEGCGIGAHAITSRENTFLEDLYAQQDKGLGLGLGLGSSAMGVSSVGDGCSSFFRRRDVGSEECREGGNEDESTGNGRFCGRIPWGICQCISAEVDTMSSTIASNGGGDSLAPKLSPHFGGSQPLPPVHEEGLPQLLPAPAVSYSEREHAMRMEDEEPLTLDQEKSPSAMDVNVVYAEVSEGKQSDAMAMGDDCGRNEEGMERGRGEDVSGDRFREDVKCALQRALVHTERDFFQTAMQELEDRPDLVMVGSCVLVFLIHHQDLFCLNLGDSRTVLATMRDPDGDGELSERLQAVQLSQTHCVDYAPERERVIREHADDPSAVVGRRVKGKLRLTRAFGAGYLKSEKMNNALLGIFRVRDLESPPYISSQPFVTSHRLTPHDRFAVMGSDGLFDFFSNAEVVDLVERFLCETPHGDAAKHLLEQLVIRAADQAGMSVAQLKAIPAGERRNYHDDVTVIVVTLGSSSFRTSSASTLL